MNKNVVLSILSVSLLTNCASIAKDVSASHAKNEARKVVKQLGLKPEILKEGKSCKHIGLIGDDSIETANKKGGIKYKILDYKDKNILYSCTYSYGLEKTPQELLIGKVKSLFK